MSALIEGNELNGEPRRGAAAPKGAFALRLALLLALILSFHAPAPLAASCQPSSGAAGWWPANGSAADVINGNNAVLVNTPTYTTGAVGQGWLFDDDHDLVTVPHSAAYNFTGFSVEAWFRRDAIEPTGWATVVEKIPSPPDGTGWSLSIESGQLWFSSGTFANGPRSAVLPVDGLFHHAVATFAAGTGRLYLDGVLVASAPMTGTLNNTASLGIGRYIGDDTPLRGAIDEVTLYNGALPALRVAALYAAGSAGKCLPTCATPPTGMISWWKAEGTTSDSKDSNPGVLVNGATYGPGIVGQAFSFDGVDDQVSVADAANLNPSSAITVDAWVRPTLYACSDARRVVNKLAAGPLAGWNLDILCATGRPRVEVFDTNGTDNTVSSPSGTLPLNAWSHVAFTYDETELILYVNGNPVASTPVAGLGIGANSEPLRIGAWAAQPPFAGQIDEVRVYNRALGASEIGAIAAARTQGLCAVVDDDGDGFASDVDCDDHNPAVHPGAAEICNNLDDDCNGTIDEAVTQACYSGPAGTDGVGSCHAGVAICVAGVYGACVGEVTPAASDVTCNGVDENCNGTADDGYVAPETSCGTGACHAIGALACTGGSIHDTCTPGAPSEEVCNGIDDDCDVLVDEWVERACYTGPEGTEGVGICRGGFSYCVAGTFGECIGQATPAPGDDGCDGYDDNCNGLIDEGFVTTANSCGTGACQASGSLVCSGGSILDTCVPGTPAVEVCNGVDDDCDGSTDEALVQACYTGPGGTEGVGTCHGGTSTCAAGSYGACAGEVTPAASDATCNGLDEDCSGSADEDYLPPATACGVGACASAGALVCSSGTTHDTCAPGSPATDDATCNHVDDDCDGSIDEESSGSPAGLVFATPSTTVQVVSGSQAGFTAQAMNTGTSGVILTGATFVAGFAVPGVSDLSTFPVTLCPGESTTLSLEADAGAAIGGTYSGVLAVSGPAGTAAHSIDVVVVAAPLPDLTLLGAPAVSFNGTSGPPPVGDTEDFVVHATVANVGPVPAGPFRVSLFDGSVRIGYVDLAGLGDHGASIPVDVPVTGGSLSVGTHVITVQVMPPSGGESSTGNNAANGLLQVGSPVVTGAVIVVTLSAGMECTGTIIDASGDATYYVAGPEGSLSAYPVKGADVTVDLYDVTGTIYVGRLGTLHTTVDGRFSLANLVALPGTYSVRAQVTDFSLTGEDVAPVTVTGVNACGGSGGSGLPPNPFIDLRLCGDDIRFFEGDCTTPLSGAATPGGTVCVQAIIENGGNAPAQPTPVAISANVRGASGFTRYALEVSPPTIAPGPGESVTVQALWPSGATPALAAGEHLVSVAIDPVQVQGSIANDRASRGFRAGSGTPATPIEVSAGAGGCYGTASANGIALYAAANVPVACGTASLTIRDAANQVVGVPSTTGTAIDGRYDVLVQTGGPLPPGHYTAEVLVTDGALTGSTITSFDCVPPTYDPVVGPPPVVAGESHDLFVYSEDIDFRGDSACSTGLASNPDPNQGIGIFTTLHHAGDPLPAPQSVQVTELVPDGFGGFTPTIIPNAQTVSFATGNGFQSICVPWTPQALGTRIIEVSFPAPTIVQNTSNDAATRAITVGDAECRLDVDAVRLAIRPGGSTTIVVSGSDVSALTSAMDLSVIEIPGGTTPAWLHVTGQVQDLTLPFQVVLTIAIDANAPAGRHSLLVVGAGDACTAIAAVTLDIPACVDADGDGAYAIGSCPLATDCDDTNENVNPHATEQCNGVDDDCDGVVDNGGDALCLDANACDGAETCGGAAGCLAGTPPACNDGLGCTTDTCQPTGYNTYACATSIDANRCLVGGVCYAETALDPLDQCRQCNSAVSQTAFSTRTNGSTCDDGNAGTVNDVCTGGVCAGVDRCAGVVCSALDQCHTAGTCNPATGLCSNPARVDGSACSDGDACTQTDTCVAGVCTGSNPVTCAAGDQCHAAGTCNPATGVCSSGLTLPDGTSCSDGNACTLTDTCQAGVCRSLTYAWSGVLQPINQDGSSIFKLGSTVPVKFRLTSPCVPTGTFVAKIFLAKITNDILGTEVEATSTSAADSGNTFRYAGGADDHYIYNLATKTFTNGSTTPMSAGTWQLRIAQYNGSTEIGTLGTVIISLRK